MANEVISEYQLQNERDIALKCLGYSATPLKMEIAPNLAKEALAAKRKHSLWLARECRVCVLICLDLPLHRRSSLELPDVTGCYVEMPACGMRSIPDSPRIDGLL